MAGYQTLEALRPILHRGPPAAPVVDVGLVRPKGGFVSKQGRRTPTWVIAEMVERRKAGEPVSTIAAAVGVSTFTVLYHTKGVQAPIDGWSTPWTGGNRRKREINVEFAKRLRRCGFSWAEIGQELGVADSIVRERLGVRHRTRKPATDLEKAKRRVARLMGVPSQKMMRDLEQSGRAPQVISRARMILFWVCRNRLGMANSEIGSQLGGFDRDMVGYCVRRVDLAMAAAQLPADAPVGRITRMLIDAEWPKASA